VTVHGVTIQRDVPPRRKQRGHRGVHLVIAVVSIVASLTLGACCTATSPTTTGHVAGFIYSRSGVNPTPVSVQASVTATSSDGASRIYSTDTAGDGSFSFDLPCGTYELNATMTSPRAGDRSTPAEVTVTASGVSNMDLYINYP